MPYKRLIRFSNLYEKSDCLYFHIAHFARFQPGSKFRLQWHEVSQESGDEEESSENEADCTYYIHVNSSISTIKSPGYPGRYENNLGSIRCIC